MGGGGAVRDVLSAATHQKMSPRSYCFGQGNFARSAFAACMGQ
jgi:hypothetical protein